MPSATAASQRMQGLYRYMADAASFVDCQTGKRVPVAQEGDNAALQSAYGAARSAPGAPVLATVEGRVLPRPKMDGVGEEPTLIVDRFVEIASQPQCITARTIATLENTYWTLVSLRGRPVTVAERQPEPHLMLQSDQKRVTGSTGCNRLAGSYSIEGERLVLGRTASTRMACVQGMEQEGSFLDALAAVTRWRVDGQQLHLMDDRGDTVASFESRPPR